LADSEFGKGVLSAANREGSPYLIDLKIAQRGHGANENWYPNISVADRRSRNI
jgi:hypothetical protein